MCKSCIFESASYEIQTSKPLWGGQWHDRKKKAFAALVILCGIAVGCSNSKPANVGGNEGKTADAPEAAADVTKYTGGPVELLVQDRNTGITQEEFDEYFAKAVKEKYPDITLKLTKETNIDKLLAAGTPPDIVAVSNTALNEYYERDYPEDLTEMITRFKIDLNKFEPSIINTLRGLAGGKGIHGLPYGMNYGAMMFNKDIFNKFGVPYPNEVITWEEYLDLAKRLTRKDGNDQYIGGTPSSVLNVLRQYGVSNVDAKDEKAVLTTPQHQQIFAFLKQFFEIPGLIQGNTYIQSNINSGKIAMQNNWITAMSTSILNNNPQFDWDLSAHPVFKEKPNIGNPVDFHMLTVNKASKNKEAAYRAILVLISEEMQMQFSKNRRITPLKNDTIRAAFASDSNIFTGKRLQSIFKVQPAPVPDYSIWKAVIDPFVNEAAKQIALNGVDINTALREQEEKANQAIKAALEAKKK
jgi:multiple sugar transport system substrate-binding protein